MEEYSNFSTQQRILPHSICIAAYCERFATRMVYGTSLLLHITLLWMGWLRGLYKLLNMDFKKTIKWYHGDQNCSFLIAISNDTTHHYWYINVCSFRWGSTWLKWLWVLGQVDWWQVDVMASDRVVGNYFLLYSLHFGVRVHKAVSLQINYKE